MSRGGVANAWFALVRGNLPLWHGTPSANSILWMILWMEFLMVAVKVPQCTLVAAKKRFFPERASAMAEPAILANAN